MSKICPICNETYNERPAMSRKVEGLEICPICGAQEAVEVLPKAEQDRIMNQIKQIYKKQRGERSQCIGT